MHNIYPIHDKTVSRSFKETLLGQRGGVFWLTGLSGSGKSTIALSAEKKLAEAGKLAAFLDGDNVRDGLCGDLGFSPEDRRENVRRVAEVAKLMVQNGLVVICTFISPRETTREMAREIIGEEDFHLIYVEASVETCQNRDPKGLYKKAVRGEIKQFTGISAPFDVPAAPSLILPTEQASVDENATSLFQYIIKHIQS